MADVVTICNAALQLVKYSKTIQSITQGTKEANACEVIFDELRDSIYEMHAWNFAIKRVKLARLTATPDFGWDYSYQLPADVIRIIGVYQDDKGRSPAEYNVEGATLGADVSDIYLKYVWRVTDPNLMPATFRLALSKLLASRLAVTLTQSAGLSKELYEQFLTQDLPTAKSSDAMQDFPDQLPESDWVGVRGGGSWFSNR